MILLFVVGFEEDGLHRACCGAGDDEYNFGGSKRCGSDGVQVCPDANKRVSWDGVHLTQHAYQLMANWLLQHITNPTTFYQSNGGKSLGWKGVWPPKALPFYFWFF